MIRIVYIASPRETRHVPRHELQHQHFLLDALLSALAKVGAMPVQPSVTWRDGRIELIARCDAIITHGEWFQAEDVRGEISAALQMGKPIFENIETLRAWLSGKGA